MAKNKKFKLKEVWRNKIKRLLWLFGVTTKAIVSTIINFIWLNLSIIFISNYVEGQAIQLTNGAATVLLIGLFIYNVFLAVNQTTIFKLVRMNYDN